MSTVRTYTNYLNKFGISDEAGRERCNEIFDTIFHGSDSERFYQSVKDDMGYIEDTGNHDVRTEGMSYGMMMCVQMDRQDEFNRLWKWAKTHMFLNEGPNKGYFAWSCRTDGIKNAMGAAPDGEEFFVMALIFAGNRWGNGSGIYDYHGEARAILHTMINKGYDGTEGQAMFDRETGYIKFVTEVEFTDPSYHLPHFYELYTQVADAADAEFCKRAAAASRVFWKSACHPVTGLNSEYADYDGNPQKTNYNMYGGRHDWFFSDAYRTIMNIALDSVWFGSTSWAIEEGKKLQSFFCGRGSNYEHEVYDCSGNAVRNPLEPMHPVAMIATNAAATLLTGDTKEGKDCLRKFLNTSLRTGKRRYYDNCLYFFAYLALSGNYRIYT